jgi:hypothetical protein
MIFFCLTLALVAPRQAAVVRIPVGVVAPTSVSDSLVNRVCAEADAIWRPQGIAFVCHRVDAHDKASDWLDVTIDDLRADREPEHALGWITFINGVPERSIHLSQACVERLLDGEPGLRGITITPHEILVGRALGRALAHELGHYLLQSDVHTPHGLMRAAWTAEESFDVGRGGFTLTPNERATAIARFNQHGH